MDTGIKERFSEADICAFLPEDLALYSVWMPGDDPSGATITEIYPRVKRADSLIIENDDMALACTIYLMQSGVPVFKDARMETAYCDAVVDGLKRGLAPVAARDAALSAIGMEKAAL